MTTGKTIALTRWTFVGQVISLLFNMLYRLVITFLPRSKRLLISWLQSEEISWGFLYLFHPTPVLLPGKSHGQRSLVGCSPWGREESDKTEHLHFHFSLSCIGEGNGNLLQCSCLENPRDRGAWWAAVYGVTQSRTWLKRLSSSSSHRITVHFRGQSQALLVICTSDQLVTSSRMQWFPHHIQY